MPGGGLPAVASNDILDSEIVSVLVNIDVKVKPVPDPLLEAPGEEPGTFGEPVPPVVNENEYE